MNDKQNEILLILQEECAEVIQAISKIKRFGHKDNIEQLEQEIADVLCMINLAFVYNIMKWDDEQVMKRVGKKEESLKRYSTIYEKS